MDIFVIVYLNNILIYTKDPGQPHIKVVCWILDQLWKYLLFANLKKCCFHQDEVRFLGYVVSSKGISMEAKRFEVVKEWPESKSVQDIQVFLGFANFYWRFIQDFSRIAAPLTSMLKTAAPPESSILEEVGDGKGNDSVDSGVEIAKKSKKSKGKKSAKSQKLSKSEKSKGEKSKKPPKSGNSPNFGATGSGPSFLTPEARSAFNRLRLAFTKAPILRHFDPECHIWIETNASGYAIGDVLSQLASGTSPDGVVTKTDLGQWHSVAFFLRKMILAEIQYETHNGELLAIVEAFKT